MSIRDGAYCPGCGLPNYEGLCPVCRGDEQGYMDELHPHFGDFYRGQSECARPDADGGTLKERFQEHYPDGVQEGEG